MTGYSWIACVSGLMNAQPGSSAPVVTLWFALSNTMPTYPGLMFRHAENVKMSRISATTATMKIVPTRTRGRRGLGELRAMERINQTTTKAAGGE